MLTKQRFCQNWRDKSVGEYESNPALSPIIDSQDDVLNEMYGAE